MKPWRWFRRGNDGLTDRQRARMTALFHKTIGSRAELRIYRPITEAEEAEDEW